jgi:hypothetical protein
LEKIRQSITFIVEWVTLTNNLNSCSDMFSTETIEPTSPAALGKSPVYRGQQVYVT